MPKPTQCPLCQSSLQEKKGVSKETGIPYHFYGCTGFPDCKYTWNPPKDAPQAPQSPPDAPKPQKGSYTQIQLELDIETIKNAVMRIEALMLKQLEPEDEVNTDGL